MKARPNLNEDQLAVTVAQEYRLHDVELTYIPAGQDAYAYRVSSLNETYHLKIYRRELPWDAVFKVPTLLQKKFGLKGAVAPIETVNEQHSFIVGGYRVALFPFIDAVSMEAFQFTPEQLRETGRFLAILHGLTDHIRRRGLSIQLPRENYDLPHSEGFRQVMDALNSAAQSEKEHHRKFADMVKPLEKHIEAEFEAYQRAAEAAKAEDEPLVLCHSDPTGGNILGGDVVYFIDWDGVMLAPRERDLIFFTDPAKAPVIEAYGEVTLNPAVVEYYRRMWNIQEIADFGQSILFENHGDSRQAIAQTAHDLAEMKRFLAYSGLDKG